MNSGIYQIKNKINGKFYIGSAVNFIKRKANHFIFLKNGNHPNIHLQRASQKYGVDNLEFMVLEYVEVDKLIEREQLWIDWTNPKYNILKVAGSVLGFKHSEETKNKYYKNKKDKEETKLKKSLATKGRPKSDLHKAKIGAGNRKLQLWPHEDGNKCKCEQCTIQRNAMKRNSPSYHWGKYIYD